VALKGGRHIPGQQVSDAVDGVIGGLTEHDSEIEVRIEMVELTRPSPSRIVASVQFLRTAPGRPREF